MPQPSAFVTGSKGLVKENVPVIRITRILLSRSEECLNGRFIDDLHIIIVKEQPVVVAFHETDIVPMVGPTPDVDNNSE